MMTLRDVVIRGARLIDPADGRDRIADLLIRGGNILAVEAFVPPPDGADIVEGRDLVLCPGLVDIRMTVGEPGGPYRETVRSVAEASAAGGITTVAALPDSDPAVDEPALVRLLRARGEETGSITVLPYAAATRGCRGEQLAEYGLLREAGAVGFTDGARPVASSRMMRLALTYARVFGAVVVQRPEDPALAEGGVATEGALATRLGLAGVPAAAEALMVARDLRLAVLTGARLHLSPVTTAESLELIRRAKADGIAVTCDTAPPYFDLNETAIGGWRTFARLRPPLRTESDRLAVVAGLADGTIDAIASDHQPRGVEEKRVPFAEAMPGGVGLPTLLAVTLAQVHGGALELPQAIRLLTAGPARVLGLDAGTLRPGAPADLCLFHPDRAWQVVSGELPGRPQNTPFDGRALEGRVVGTWKAGRRVFG